jgi:hypothetical protein
MRLFPRLRRWLSAASRPPELPVPFTVTCASGHVVRGFRQRRHQVVRCRECGESLFVLPRSPFPSLQQADGSPSPSARASPWRRPLLAAALTVIVVAGALTVFFTVLTRKGATPQEIEARIAAGQQAISEGKMHRAAQEFDVAQQLLSQDPNSLSAARTRELRQLQRQAHVLTDLLSESLDELLLRASRSQEDEWQAQFQQRYRGAGKANAVIFDVQVRRDGAGQFQHDWHLQAGVEPARLEISDLKILHGLPLQQPQRLLFGARLDHVMREQNGVWVVRFDPDSGVLLTDEQAARACCPPSMDKELPGLLEQQRKWLEGK